MGDVSLNLHTPDFTTAQRVVDALNHAIGESAARALDAVTISVHAPADPSARVGFMAKIENVELEPGDALYLPKLWWHQVEATAPFNGLVNYWWDAFAAGPDAPYTSMLLAMIAIAERPAPERAAWRALFDHYVFRERGHPLAHLPAERHGLLGPLTENYGKIRARVMYLLRGGP